VRPAASVLLLALLTGSVVCAPAPFARTPGPLDRDPLYREAEADVRKALGQIEQAQKEVAELSPGEFIGQIRDARLLLRKAAEKYARLEASWKGAALADRALLAHKTGTTWSLGGDYAKALPYFTAVLDRTTSATLRAEAVAGCVHCYWNLGRPDEVRRLAKQAQQARPFLNDGDRQRLDDELRWAERANALK
jgi:tetratricopeptide (TPR) repeat protein